ncbi:MAG: hypothetical protein Q4F38_07920 [Akkermansia sp.]|nr:hypothetical protein [Akkermansia sp.]
MTQEPPSKLLTALDICNLALSKLGEAPLSEINPNGCPASRLCYLHYHPVRREILCTSRWTFACKLITLHSEDDSVPCSHACTLPHDCLRVLEVNSRQWTLRGRSIYSPNQSVRVLYIADVEDTTTFDPLFVEAFATRLACKLCIPLTSSTTAREALTQEYHRIALPSAAHFNAVQSHSNDSHPLYQLWKNRTHL